MLVMVLFGGCGTVVPSPSIDNSGEAILIKFKGVPKNIDINLSVTYN